MLLKNYIIYIKNRILLNYILSYIYFYNFFFTILKIFTVLNYNIYKSYFFINFLTNICFFLIYIQWHKLKKLSYEKFIYIFVCLIYFSL